MSNIVETLTESKAHALSEHGFIGNLAQGKSMQTHLTANALIQSRTIQGNLLAQPTPPTFAECANIIAYLNAYDMSTIAWGSILIADFPDPSATVPSQTETLAQVVFARSYSNGNGAFQRNQIIVQSYPYEFEYLIMSTVSNGQNPFPFTFALMGCQSGKFSAPQIIEMPLPPDQPDYYTVGGSGPYPPLNEYRLAVVGPKNNLATPQIEPNLESWVEGITLGPDWNAGLACQVPAGPPFA